MAERIYYPIGEQDFKSLRNDGCIYIDKTPFIAKILENKHKYFYSFITISMQLPN